VEQQIVGPKNGTTTMGFSQDSLLGACLMTGKDIFLNRDEVMNLVMWVQANDQDSVDISEQLPMPAILGPKPLWTGKQLISLILPK
jgi:DNA-directed RNA polymerase II subunit RPB1